MSSPALPAARSKVPVIVLSALTVLLVVACLVLAFVVHSNRQHRNDLDDAREAALSAARQAITNLDSLSSATIDADIKRVLAGSTGSFKDQFAKAAPDLKSVVVQRKTVSTATVLSAGIERADDNSASVLIAVDRNVKDSSDADGALQHDRWKVSLEKHGGRWLVAELDPVS